MKISKLYIKNFITVMIIIVVAQICIAGLFRIIGSDAGRKDFQSDLFSTAFLLRKFLDTDYLNLDKKELALFLKNLSKAWSSDIWLEDKNGNLIAFSSKIKRPPFPEKMEKFPEYGLSKNIGGPPLIYVIINSTDRKIKLFIKRKNINIYLREIHFIIGLCIITVVIALVLFPISKKITDPLKRLTESANAIAKGKFDIYVKNNSHDEVGELAKTFNKMSRQVLQMINGTKELTANISHQIRSPLSRISVSTELMRNKITSGNIDSIGPILLSIENEIADIVKITEKIIELIRVDIAHKNKEYIKINIVDIISDISVKFSDLIDQKLIIYKEIIPRENFYIYGVNHDIYEVFEILYDNAVRYSPSQGIISLNIYERNNQIIIVLTNNSIRFTKKMLKSIFEPFKRCAPEKIPGNGLGLAIAKKIIKNHEASITAQSVKEKFSIKIIFKKYTE